MNNTKSKNLFFFSLVAGVITCACGGDVFSARGLDDMPDAAAGGTLATTSKRTSSGGAAALSTGGVTAATGGDSVVSVTAGGAGANSVNSIAGAKTTGGSSG